MKARFTNPPQRYRMLQIMHHIAHHDDVAPQIDALEQGHYGGAVINAPFIDYLRSDEQWNRFVTALEALQTEGFECWIYDEHGYPSGKAGGLTMEGHPEYECLGVLCARTEGRGTLTHAMPAGERITCPPLRVLAAPIEDGVYRLDRAVDLTGDVADGQSELTWEAPGGVWGMLSFHVNRMREGTHIVLNLSDDLPYIDIMNPEAVKRFIEVTHEAYAEHAPGPIDRYARAFFTDEPSLMSFYLRDEEGLLPPAPWSLYLPDAYKETHGRDIREALPYLFVDCGEDTPYQRVAYWRTVADLIERNYFGLIDDWCREHGVHSSGHCLLEEQFHHHVVATGDLYAALRRMGVPGIDNLSSDPAALVRHPHVPPPKFVSSVTHMIGAPECMSESSSHVQRVRELPCSYEQRIGAINWQYVLGLTRVTSYYGMDEFTDEQRVEFNDHIGRLGALLNAGRHIADVAVYYPIASMWAAYVPTDESVYHPPVGDRAKAVNAALPGVSYDLLGAQLDFDYLDDQAILESDVEAGRLKVAGESFSCLVLPEAWLAPAETCAKIEAFAKSGGAVVIAGSPPSHGRTARETERVTAITARLLEMERVVRVSGPKEVSEAVRRLIEPDVTLDAPCAELYALHREVEGKQVYFLANSSGERVTRSVTFRSGGRAEQWHPTTGAIEPLETGTSAGISTVSLEFAPFEGYFVVFGRQ